MGLKEGHKKNHEDGKRDRSQQQDRAAKKLNTQGQNIMISMKNTQNVKF